jgi:dihydroorotate dehydrogenase
MGNYIDNNEAKERSIFLLKKAFEYSNNKLVLISSGGVTDGADILKRIKNGASFVLIYSALYSRVNIHYFIFRVLLSLIN